ncbi:MAG: hypothetical protein ACJAYW_000226 [Candidatus Azotimanducaceae bacterium]|jgi:hypothetical protein
MGANVPVAVMWSLAFSQYFYIIYPMQISRNSPMAHRENHLTRTTKKLKSRTESLHSKSNISQNK